MSGNTDDPKASGEKVREVRMHYKVDKKTAERIIECSTVEALERMKKWTDNHKRTKKQEAEDVLADIKLVRKRLKERKGVDEVLTRIEVGVVGLATYG